MIENLPALINNNASVVSRGRFVTADMRLLVGNDEYRVVIEAGQITAVECGPFLMRPYSISISASAAAWSKFWQRYPPPGYHDIFAMTKSGEAEVSGDWRLFMQNLRYFKDLLEAPRQLARRSADA